MPRACSRSSRAGRHGRAEAVGSVVKVAAGDNGAQRLTYRIGPFNIIPGQNDIDTQVIAQKPKVDGWITRIRPDLIYTNGKVPRVDVLHLHHGVWLNAGRQDATSPGLPERFFAAGEEKTIMSFPKGYGYEYEADDTWLLNHMIHNLTPVPTQGLHGLRDRLHPEDLAQGARDQAGPPDLDGRRERLVLPGLQRGEGRGREGLYTYPNDEPAAYQGGRKQQRVDGRPRTACSSPTAGHLHPGGLHTDLWVRRQGARIAEAGLREQELGQARASAASANAPRGRGSNAHLFRSNAKYYEPAGAVSWDVAMTGTRHDWAVKVQQGRHALDQRDLRHQARRLVGVDGDHGRLHGRAAARARTPTRSASTSPASRPTGTCAENNNHGGGRPTCPTRASCADGRRQRRAARHPRLQVRARRPQPGRPGQAAAGDQQGQSATFRNLESARQAPLPLDHLLQGALHRKTGIAYPLADGPVQFESNTLGTHIPAAGATEWKTPANLNAGTYTYFCRIHPFMRGAFRVK